MVWAERDYAKLSYFVASAVVVGKALGRCEIACI